MTNTNKVFELVMELNNPIRLRSSVGVSGEIVADYNCGLIVTIYRRIRATQHTRE